MDGTPRLRSAFPATPQASRRYKQSEGSPKAQRRSLPLPDIPALQSTVQATSSTPPSEPLIPERILDAPTQRLWAFTFWVALWSWKIWDFYTLQESEEQSLWLFMKWIAMDGLTLFGLPTLRIPWLEWSSATMTLLFCAHAVADGMMMFRIPLPIGAGFAALGRSVWGAYEMALNEHSVNPETVRFNDSLILGRQVIHILPEGSAILNPDRSAFCIDSSRTEVRLPIMINSTNPISMEIFRVDMETQVNETLVLGRREIKQMHKDASRLLSYSDKPNEPKTLYYLAKKPGIYILAKVVDESNLEVARKKMAHTVVAPCPKAAVIPSTSDRCKGELSNVELEVTGTPPLRLKYRKMVNTITQDATLESIQPEDFVSPLSKTEQNALAVPNRVDLDWAKPQKVRVPLSESLGSGGKWVYSIQEVKDGFGNIVTYSALDNTKQEKHAYKSSDLHQVITVHERPTVNLRGCTPQQPLKVASGSSAHLPLQLSSTGRGELSDTTYHIDYLFSPQDAISATGQHSEAAEKKRETLRNAKQQPIIKQPGLYTVTGVSSDFCKGEVLEPDTCLLQNPPEPKLSIKAEEIFDKCAGSPIGLRVDLDLIGTPPFDIQYRMTRKGDQNHSTHVEKIHGLRGQIELTPKQAGDYKYEFVEITDTVYKGRRVDNIQLEQSVKPAASATLTHAHERKISCIDEKVSFGVVLQGEGPFSIEYELVHGGKRAKYTLDNINQERISIETDPLHDGGDYTLALASVTDRMGCKEFLKDEARVTVRHQKPKVSFGQIEGRRALDTLEGKKVQLPLRLAGEPPWTVKYLDAHGKENALTARQPNDRLLVEGEGKYELIDVRDAVCPGSVDELAKDFEVSWIARPEVRIPTGDNLERKGNALVKADVCEGDDDAVDILFKGSPPYTLHYVEHVKPERGAMAPKNKEVRAALNIATLRMDTAQAGSYEYKLNKLEDANYEHSSRHFAPLTVQQRVNARPSVAFTNPGKTYSFCSVESDGEEVIPITLQGVPPFDVEVEIKHHGTMKPETTSLTGITGHSHNIRIPHSKIHLGKSAIALRRVSDSRGCSRILDSTTPRVQISVHDAPTITALENHDHFCVGDRINFALSGVAPFTVIYNFEGHTRKAIASSATFRRLAEKPGTFAIVGLQDSASQCRATSNITKQIHGLPSVRVSKGRESYVDIHEGGEAEILFEFGGVPPFEFTYTRSSNTEKGGKKGVVLDMRSEASQEHSLRISASEEGTYEVVAIKDRYCAYAKPGVKVDSKKLLTN